MKSFFYIRYTSLQITTHIVISVIIPQMCGPALQNFAIIFTTIFSPCTFLPTRSKKTTETNRTFRQRDIVFPLVREWHLINRISCLRANIRYLDNFSRVHTAFRRYHRCVSARTSRVLTAVRKLRPSKEEISHSGSLTHNLPPAVLQSTVRSTEPNFRPIDSYRC